MKNSADLGGCYPPRPSASVDNTLSLDQQNSSYPTKPHSIIANFRFSEVRPKRSRFARWIARLRSNISCQRKDVDQLDALPSNPYASVGYQVNPQVGSKLTYSVNLEMKPAEVKI